MTLDTTGERVDLWAEHEEARWRCPGCQQRLPCRDHAEERVRRVAQVVFGAGAIAIVCVTERSRGITVPSFHAAFGSKEDLFREAVELSTKTQGAPIGKALKEGRTARVSVEAMLRASAEHVCGQSNPRGCTMVLAGINCAAANKGVEDFLCEQRALREKGLRQRLRGGIAEGDLPASTDVNGLVSFYTSILDGMAMRARDVAQSPGRHRQIRDGGLGYRCPIGQDFDSFVDHDYRRAAVWTFFKDDESEAAVNLRATP